MSTVPSPKCQLHRTVDRVEPDIENIANGGFNPLNGGQPTWPVDPTVYIGALDIEVSR